MKALSLIQPWASLIACGAKRYETRSWSTRHRGPLAIHASNRRPTDDIDEDLRRIVAAAFGPDWLMTLPRGVVLATCRLADCRPTAAVYPTIDARERACGNYDVGRFAFRLDDLQRCEPPVRARGALGLWEWDPSVEFVAAVRVPRAARQGTLL
jgi:hypothetical protein